MQYALSEILLSVYLYIFLIRLVRDDARFLADDETSRKLLITETATTFEMSIPCFKV